MSTTDPHRSDTTSSTGAAPGPAVPAGADAPDAGRHAVSRPAPTPPAPAAAGPPDPVRAPTATRPVQPDAELPPTGRTAPPGPPAPADDDELFPDPNAPRTAHTGSHVLGALVGLVLAPLALGLLLLGQSRILAVQVDGWDASLELLGIVLVSVGAVLLAGLLVLGLWTAAVPIAAGVVLGALGGLQVYAPGIARMTTLDVVGADAWHLTVTQVSVAGASGTTLVAGVLLLTAGVVAALARRHGVRLGTFRERNRAV